MSCTTGNSAFNPEFCPLLQGLTPEEKQRRMEQDPVIRGCMLAMDAGKGDGLDCRAAFERKREKFEKAAKKKAAASSA